MVPGHHLSPMGFGYSVAETQTATKAAIKQARQMSSDVTKKGMEMRRWSVDLRNRLDKFINASFQSTSAAVTMKTAGQFELEIGRSVREYFASIAQGMVGLKSLNPPLSNEQLDPYLEEMLDDRRRTMVDLEPLSRYLNQLQDLKSRLAVLKP
jgi:hypothetical protein